MSDDHREPWSSFIIKTLAASAIAVLFAFVQFLFQNKIEENSIKRKEEIDTLKEIISSIRSRKYYEEILQKCVEQNSRMEGADYDNLRRVIADWNTNNQNWEILIGTIFPDEPLLRGIVIYRDAIDSTILSDRDLHSNFYRLHKINIENYNKKKSHDKKDTELVKRHWKEINEKLQILNKRFIEKITDTKFPVSDNSKPPNESLHRTIN